jgi:hypothetical protein
LPSWLRSGSCGRWKYLNRCSQSPRWDCSVSNGGLQWSASLTDDVLDRIDEIAPPGTDVGPLEAGHNPPAILKAELRRRPIADRAAA